jgi:hypothetical protein
MRQIAIFSFGCILILCSCSPKITTSITTNYPPLNYKEDVRVFGMQDAVPANAQQIGIVKIGDTGFTTDCSWEFVIDKAKTEARKVGGNAIKITEHLAPDVWTSTCHRITAKILRVDSYANFIPGIEVDSALINADYALLHIYRDKGVGALVAYDLHLGDTVICRVTSNWKKTITIRRDGLNTLWARTEAKVEIPINIKYGQEYYIRCSLTMGAFVGHPNIELMDNDVGKSEFHLIKSSKSATNDIIYLKDGRIIECRIVSEDSYNVFLIIFKNGEEIKTQVSKKEVKSIQRSE